MIVDCPVAAFAARAPGAPALRFVSFGAPPVILSAAELDARVRTWQGWLRAEGLTAADRLALSSYGSPDALALIYACAREGVVVALPSARLAPAELAPLLARLRPRRVVAPPALVAAVPAGAPLTTPAATAATDPARWDLARPLAVLFTSGTEGPPKGAVLTAGALVASARAAVELLGLEAGGAWVSPLPLFHVGGLGAALRCALAGAALWQHERFDAAAAADDLASGATHASFVAVTLTRTLDALGARTVPERLRAVMVGGGPVPAAVLARARAARVPVVQTYGLTEAASHVCCERPDDADGATAGPAVPGTEVRVVSADGAPLPAGFVGIIEVRGASLLAGYLDDPDATARALRGGWLRTGDLGTLDAHGRLVVQARRLDLIVTGGENVYPAEVEAALLTHPAVAEAAVLGEADATWGQRVVAAVVLRAPASSGELAAHCRARLAAFKVPRVLRVVESLPRTPVGKLDRRALRDALGLARLDVG